MIFSFFKASNSTNGYINSNNLNDSSSVNTKVLVVRITKVVLWSLTNCFYYGYDCYFY